MDYIMTTSFNTGKKTLDTQLEGIKKEFNNGLKASENIAKRLKDIRDKELYKGSIYESFEDVASLFGLGKSQAYRLIQTYEKKHAETLEEYLVDYSLSQVAELTLEESDIVDLIDARNITQDMSCKKIREVVKAFKNIDVDDSEDAQDAETETDEENIDETDEEAVEGLVVLYNGTRYEITDDKLKLKVANYLYKQGIIDEVIY